MAEESRPLSERIEALSLECLIIASTLSAEDEELAEPTSPKTCIKDIIVRDFLKFLNSADKEKLENLKGVRPKKVTRILELRETEPFKSLDDLEAIGLSSKQIKGMMKGFALSLLD